MKHKDKSTRTLTMQSICRTMMEEGHYPTFKKTHILFNLDDNTAVVEYEEGILSVRLFFTIEEEAYDMFLEASNQAMLGTYIVKPVLMNDMQTIMFSCETFCDNLREFRKLFPRCIEMLEESISAHKQEMKKLILDKDSISKRIPATDDWSSAAGSSKHHKILS